MVILFVFLFAFLGYVIYSTNPEKFKENISKAFILRKKTPFSPYTSTDWHDTSWRKYQFRGGKEV